MEFYEQDQCVRCGDVLESFPGMSSEDRMKKRKNKQHAEEWEGAMQVSTGKAERDWAEQDVVETIEQSAELISTFWFVPTSEFRKQIEYEPEEVGAKKCRLLAEGGGLSSSGVLVKPQRSDDPYRWRRVELKSRARVTWKTKKMQHRESLRAAQAEELFKHLAKRTASERSEDSYSRVYIVAGAAHICPFFVDLSVHRTLVCVLTHELPFQTIFRISCPSIATA